MSRCLSCAGPDGFHEPHCQQERDSLRAENARLQERVEEAERELERHRAAASRTILRRDVLRLQKECDEAKAQAERRKRALEWLGTATALLLLEIEAEEVPLTQALDVKMGVADDALVPARAAIEEKP